MSRGVASSFALSVQARKDAAGDGVERFETVLALGKTLGEARVARVERAREFGRLALRIFEQAPEGRDRALVPLAVAKSGCDGSSGLVPITPMTLAPSTGTGPSTGSWS